MSLTTRVLGPTRPYWAHVSALLLLGLLSIPLALLAPLPLKIAVDSVVGSHPLQRALDPLVPDAVIRSPGALLAMAIGLLVAVALLEQLQGLATAVLRARLKENRVAGIQHEAPAVPYVLTESLVHFISASATLIAIIYVMARIDWQLALVALAVWPGLVVTAQAIRRRLRRPSREAKRLAIAAGTAAVLLVGIHHVRSGLITLGDVLLVMGYVSPAYESLRTIVRKAARLRLQLASARPAFALPDEPSEIEEGPNARPLPRARGAIVFHHVSLADGKDLPVLHDISFDVEPGTRLGIVGASPAVKSALISLLTRSRDPTAGQVWLDGIDHRDYKVEDLRRQFAVVPQDPVLLSATIAENIGRARPGTARDEVIAAAQAANADDFIVRLPQGYDTQVGERGLQLSSGQRQRIAIAQAFLKDSPVLILDEPTSAVDADAEAAILGALRRLMRGRTVILITHRPSMLEGCQAVLVLENGRVVADTTRPLAGAGAPTAPSVVSGRRPTIMSHPAVRAWLELFPDAEPLRISPLRVRKRKNQIYRLDLARRNGAAVVAKRCGKDTARVERTVYEEILPRVAVPSLGYHGCFEEPDGEHCWLFMEVATGENYSNLLAEHRVEAAHWLGLLHTSATDVAVNGRLPDGGPSRYLDRLRAARESMQQHMDNPVLTPDDVLFIEEIQARLADLAARWDRLGAACEGVPKTLVHGDFNGQNLRLRSANGHTGVVVFDWEDAGWGVPAADLAQLSVPSGKLSANPDIPTYWATVRDRWPNTSAEALRRLAYCGTVFRALAALYWNAQELSHDWAHAYAVDMHVYAAELDDALERLDWVRGASPARREVVGT